MNNADFQGLVERAMAVGSYASMRPAIEKELLHYDILFALDKEGVLDRLCFQGGTCLRLCHGAPRLSEDLDFVGGRDFSAVDIPPIKACLERYIGRRYALPISVSEPRPSARMAGNTDITVAKWQISIETAPGRADLPRQRIKIEIASLPAYTREPRALQRNYEFLPDGYVDMLVTAETLDEIMADKLISLVNSRYLRHRDIWDLRWIAQRGIKPDASLLRAKVADYHVDDYGKRVESLRTRLPEIIHGKELSDTLTRFIPMEVQKRTLRRAKFLDYLANETDELLKQAGDAAR